MCIVYSILLWPTEESRIPVLTMLNLSRLKRIHGASSMCVLLRHTQNAAEGSVLDRLGRSKTPFNLGIICSKYMCKKSIPVAVRSKAWVYGRSLIRIVGSNPSGSMDACLL